MRVAGCNVSISSLMLSKSRLSAVLVLRKAGTAVARPGAEKAVVGPVEKEGGAETEFCYAVAKPRSTSGSCGTDRPVRSWESYKYELFVAS
jgi:hypothetical protein